MINTVNPVAVCCHLWSKMGPFITQNLSPHVPYHSLNPPSLLHLLLNIHRHAFKTAGPEAVGWVPLLLCLRVWLCEHLLSYCLHSSRVKSPEPLQLVPPCLSPCPTTTGRNRSQCEASPVSRMWLSWSRISTGISTLRWSRTEMWRPEGITTLLSPTLCGNTWLAGGSEPSSITMRRIPK